MPVLFYARGLRLRRVLLAYQLIVAIALAANILNQETHLGDDGFEWQIRALLAASTLVLSASHCLCQDEETRSAASSSQCWCMPTTQLVSSCLACCMPALRKASLLAHAAITGVHGVDLALPCLDLSRLVSAVHHAGTLSILGIASVLFCINWTLKWNDFCFYHEEMKAAND